ncbi:MAG: glycosyltransferase family 4 protein [Thermoanaerobaculia bacterium]
MKSSPIRVGFVAHELVSSNGRGLQRYLVGLASALEETGEAEVTLFSREPLSEQFSHLRGAREVWVGRREVLWEQVELPMRARRRGLDVLHATSNRGLPLIAPCPFVLTRHDEIERMFPPDFETSWRGNLRRSWSDWVSIRSAACVVTVSETSRRDILREWALEPDRVRALGEGIDDKFFAGVDSRDIQAVRKTYGIDLPYVCYLGGFEGRKRVDVLVDAFLTLKGRDRLLVLAGDRRGESGWLADRLGSHPQASSVKVLGRVSDSDAMALVAGADLFGFPSRYEGFGLPVAEAMALGTPVLCSDGGALPEVAGGAARVFPAGDVDACRLAMEDILNDETLANALREKGRQRAEGFRWKHVARGYLRLYRELSGKGRRREG